MGVPFRRRPSGAEAMNQVYLDSARLLTRVAPLVFVDDTFALKGGTAINLFVRDMPRLSVDLDLVFPDHTLPREQALRRINEAIRQSAARLQKQGFQTHAPAAAVSGETKLLVRRGHIEVKIEVNFVMRGTVLPVRTAFRECFYIVPDYQREYVWTEKEVEQLLQDIDEEFDVGDRREYFIGTVLVSPTQQKNHFEVIDGQQRLTTFFLLLCALRQRFTGEPQYPLFTGLLSTSYTDSGGNLKTSLKLEPRYEHAGRADEFDCRNPR